MRSEGAPHEMPAATQTSAAGRHDLVAPDRELPARDLEVHLMRVRVRVRVGLGLGLGFGIRLDLEAHLGALPGSEHRLGLGLGLGLG